MSTSDSRFLFQIPLSTSNFSLSDFAVFSKDLLSCIFRLSRYSRSKFQLETKRRLKMIVMIVTAVRGLIEISCTSGNVRKYSDVVGHGNRQVEYLDDYPLLESCVGCNGKFQLHRLCNNFTFHSFY